jgi:putative transposase
LAEKLEVCKMFISKENNVKKILDFAALPRSTWYAQDKGRKRLAPLKRGRKITCFSQGPDNIYILNDKISELLKSYRASCFFHNGGGYRKLSFYINREHGIKINHKKVYRLCKEHNLLLPSNKKKKTKRNQACVNRVINCPNRLWEFDIKYGFISGENRFFYLLVFVDVFSRKVVGYHVGLSCKANSLVFTLKDALIGEGIKNHDELMIRSDNGPQMTSNAFMDAIEEMKINATISGHEFIPPSTPNKNAHIESFFSIVETELFQARFFNSFKEAYEKTVEFINFYNKRRLHGSLRFYSPIKALERFNLGIREIKEVRV